MPENVENPVPGDRYFSPAKVMIFTLSVLGGLLGLTFVPGENGIKFSEEFTLKYPTFDKFLSPPKPQKKNISSLIAVDTSLAEPVDTLVRHDNNISTVLGEPTDTSEIPVPANTQPLEFGTNDPSILHPFFEKMDQLSTSKRIVRIIHYGDSQIEGDRISSYIRQKLQAKFGGNGPGSIMANNMYHTVSFTQTFSENFERNALFGQLNKKVTHKKYGALTSFARFTPIVPDSLIATREISEGWIEIGNHKSANYNAKNFNRVRMFYGNAKSPCFLTVYNNGEIVHEDSLIADTNYHVLELRFDQTPEKLRYHFKAKDSPDIYGFSLDGNYGIALDNIAMRGGSGTFLGKSDFNLMRRMYADLEVELFIMQFGGNVMPALESEAEAKQYANWFKSNLNSLKRMRPGACIIVIGPSDMSIMNDGVYSTYEYLPVLIKEMKAATFGAGAAYWDMYTAMGGQNSMLSWVEQGLAGEDYTHFTWSGTKIIAEKFYQAFIAEYQKYQKGAIK